MKKSKCVCFASFECNQRTHKHTDRTHKNEKPLQIGQSHLNPTFRKQWDNIWPTEIHESFNLYRKTAAKLTNNLRRRLKAHSNRSRHRERQRERQLAPPRVDWDQSTYCLLRDDLSCESVDLTAELPLCKMFRIRNQLLELLRGACIWQLSKASKLTESLLHFSKWIQFKSATKALTILNRKQSQIFQI